MNGQRDAQHASHLLLVAAVLLSVAVGSALNAIAPREKPMVTIYMHPDLQELLTLARASGSERLSYANRQ